MLLTASMSKQSDGAFKYEEKSRNGNRIKILLLWDRPITYTDYTDWRLTYDGGP